MARPTRGGRFRSPARPGEFTENRKAWINTAAGQLVLMYHPAEEDAKEPGPTVTVMIPQKNTRTVSFDFTHLTGEELAAMKKFFDLAFALAEPVVALRDKVADDAFRRGDDSFSRSYRQVPQLVVRERKVGEHDESLHDGSESVSGSDVLGEDRDAGRVRGDGGGLADDESSEGLSQDDGTKAH